MGPLELVGVDAVGEVLGVDLLVWPAHLRGTVDTDASRLVEVAVTDQPSTAVAVVVDAGAFTEFTETGDTHTHDYHAQSFQCIVYRDAYGKRVLNGDVHESRLVTGLAAVFAGMTAVLAIAGVIYNPVILGVAALFAVITYVLWSHATGRLAASIYRQVEQQAATSERQQSAGRGGFGAEPREEWRGPGGGTQSRRQRERARRRGSRQQARGSRRQRFQGQRQRPPQAAQKMSAEEAYRTLEVSPGADESTVKSAYRQKVKEVHPDTDGGDEERFKQVQSAYERLTG